LKRSQFLLFSPPSIGDEEIEEVVDTLRSGWITTGPKTKRFEEVFADYVHAPGAIALSSCTAGLHTAVVTYGIKAGDEVIVPTMTFAATVNCVEHVGATPIFADVQPDTLNIEPEKVEALISPRTKALMIVHMAGHPAALDPLRAIAAHHGLAVIEDAAHALPAKYKGRFIGSDCNPAAFSFYATKNMTTGEGGMLTADREFLDKARVFVLHGLSRDAWQRYEHQGDWYYEVVVPGFKYNMTDIQASLGIRQLRKLDGFQSRRRQIVSAYMDAFSSEEALELPMERPEVEHAWYLFILRLCPEVLRIDRDRFVEELRIRNIGTSVHFIPMHLHPFYRDKYGFHPDDFPVAYSNYKRMFSLPLYPRLGDDDVNDVVEAVLDIVKTYKR
jgi:dTDP-4-amino-4,6-dideoxygalactose transaminase